MKKTSLEIEDILRDSRSAASFIAAYGKVLPQQDLVFASGATRGTASLGVGRTFFGFGAFGHHDGETDITALGVLVTRFTRVHARGIR